MHIREKIRELSKLNAFKKREVKALVKTFDQHSFKKEEIGSEEQDGGIFLYKGSKNTKLSKWIARPISLTSLEQ